MLGGMQNALATGRSIEYGLSKPTDWKCYRFSSGRRVGILRTDVFPSLLSTALCLTSSPLSQSKSASNTCSQIIPLNGMEERQTTCTATGGQCKQRKMTNMRREEITDTGRFPCESSSAIRRPVEFQFRITRINPSKLYLGLEPPSSSFPPPNHAAPSQ
jgi:hypothetical protein